MQDISEEIFTIEEERILNILIAKGCLSKT